MKRNKNITPILSRITKHSCVLLLVSSFTVNAEDRPGLLLNGAISAQHSDNVLNNVNEISDTSIIVNPQVQYLGLIGKHSFLLSYDGKFANYTENSEFNYNEHNVSTSLTLDHSHKIMTEFELNYDKKIETPGTTNSSTQSLTNFNKYENKSASAKIYYGKKTSIGQVTLGYKYNDRDYTNNQQSYRDVEQNQINATFFYRIAPKTRFLIQAIAEDYSYEDQTLTSGIVFNQSSTNNLYLAGVEWKATAKSTGIFKIGHQNKDYDDSRLVDISGLSYFLDFIWKPNTYTQVKLGADRQTTESAQLNESGFLSTSYSLDVSHKVTALTTLKAKYIKDNYDIVFSSGFADRTDKRNTFEISALHSIKDWLDIKLAYEYQEKTSNVDIYNYDSNNISFSVVTTF
ncbi:outer membrane beta-barrel protein [Pseudocolwellia sp. HL-MZ19]|uniref:outer membrane beta-barrel protein n=1 Tax=Pseudocolwellia sp. HL-MZ19 TaxID=3400846 RepID=UPI003CF5E53E